MRHREDAPKRTVVVLLAFAVLLPVLIGAVFGHPTRRVIVPESLMLTTTVALTLLGGVVPGMVSALVSTLSLWYFNFPPGLSFRVVDSRDVVAALAAGVVACGLVVLIAVIEQRQRAVIDSEARLQVQVSAQRETITMMQRALLPEFEPATPGVVLGWHYMTGEQLTAPVGGDWFAFVPVGPTRLGVAVGDVAGHGLPAVTRMAEYRYALRALAVYDASPPAVLGELDEVSRLFSLTHYSTCIYGIIDSAASEWTYSSAGHPPPLLIRDGDVQTLAAPHGPPIGTGVPARPYASTTVSLQSNDVLVLYTDGLVERRGERLDAGIDRLADRLVHRYSAGELPQVCAEVILDLVGHTPSDDVALVLLRLVESTRPRDVDSDRKRTP